MKAIGLLSFILLIGACTSIEFTEPQPQNTKVLTEFPEEFQGAYFGDDDTLFIEKDRCAIPKIYANNYSLNEIEENSKLSIRDALFYDENINYKAGLEYEIVNDTLMYNKRIMDYKIISDSFVLKKFKKYLIVNERDLESKYWTVYVVHKKGSKVNVHATGRLLTEYDNKNNEEYNGKLSDFEKITNFEEIGENSYLLNPSKSEFNKLIKKDFFPSIILELEKIE